MEIEFNSGTLICNAVLDDTSLGDDGLYIGKGGLDGMLQFLGDAGGLDAIEMGDAGLFLKPKFR